MKVFTEPQGSARFGDNARVEPQLVTLVTVSCLSCGETYGKPGGRGTVKTNPGCPRCGYLGWATAAASLTEAEELHRFGADLLQRP